MLSTTIRLGTPNSVPTGLFASNRAFSFLGGMQLSSWLSVYQGVLLIDLEQAPIEH